jgi:hypothetical protein
MVSTENEAESMLSQRASAAAIFIGLIALNVVIVPARQNEYAWGALVRTADTGVDGYIDSADFVPGATYRILRVGDGKVGMYDIVRNGGRLDSELVPESLDRRSFPTTEEYLAFLRHRHVDFVIIYEAYDRRYGTNEHHLLAEMAAGGPDGCAGLAHAGAGFEVFEIRNASGC